MSLQKNVQKQEAVRSDVDQRETRVESEKMRNERGWRRRGYNSGRSRVVRFPASRCCHCRLSPSHAVPESGMKDGQGSQCAGGGWPSSAIHDAGDRQGLEGFARAQANHGSMAEAAFPSLFHE